MRTRSAESLQTGLAFHGITNAKLDQVRYACEQHDRLDRYGWLRHDGVSFGYQDIADPHNQALLGTAFLKKPGGSNGGSWVARVNATTLPSSKAVQPPALALYLTFQIDGADSKLELQSQGHKGIDGSVHFSGYSETLGHFTIVVKPSESSHPPELPKLDKKVKAADFRKTHFWGFVKNADEQWSIKDDIVGALRRSMRETAQAVLHAREKAAGHKRKQDKQPQQMEPLPLIVPALPDDAAAGSNAYVLQLVLQVPFEVDIAFISHSGHPELAADASHSTAKKKKSAVDAVVSLLMGDRLTSDLDAAAARFDERFETAFGLSAKGYSKRKINAAKAAFSNLIGGIGYFYGTSIVKYSNEERPRLWPAQALYSAVPSRPFFPRGFLWDEGFHQLVISAWDPDISLDVLKHWTGLMHSSGWIPREQILGSEARSKVPQEFQIQFDLHANPPTLLLVLERIHRMVRDAQRAVAASNPHIDLASSGEELGATHGRDVLAANASAASAASVAARLAAVEQLYESFERWIDWFKETQHGELEHTFRWSGRTVNHTFASGLDDYPRADVPNVHELHVDLLCWMAKATQILRDISETLGKTESRARYDETYHEYLETINAIHWNDNLNAYADVATFDEGSMQHVPHQGYITLFPLLVGAIPTDSPRLEATLQLLRDKDRLWSDYGIRSLSKSDRLFGAGENYWKGPIWINVNYMVLSALQNYYVKEGPYSELARSIYAELRTNVVNNMIKNYGDTGYIWEQYHPISGVGQRSHPFTGWSSLLVLMMAEVY